MKHLPFFNGRSEKASKSQILRQTVQSVFPEANPWRATFSQIFVCNNGQDNVPIETTVTKQAESFTFVISQSRGQTKTMGQDCMGIAKHGNWEIIVLSDGHDDEGHLVSQGVCQVLPSIILRLIHDRFPEDIDKPVDDDMIFDAFDECETVVCWVQGQAQPGAYVRIAAGEYEGVAGHCTGFDEVGNAIVSVVEEFEVEGEEEIEVGFLEIIVAPEDILVPRFNGGGTCLVFIRNVVNNECRVAVAGDSRVMIYLPSEYDASYIQSDDCFVPVYGTKICQKTKRPYSAYLTQQHNVFNSQEIQRLNEDYSEAFVIKGAFLVNPETDFMIQPTRGFGDHDMHGTGYTHIPQLSNTFVLPIGSLVIAASDGVFDDNVWTERVIVDRVGELFEDKSLNANEVAKIIYDETLDRSLNSGYVDDISLVCYNAPDPSVVTKIVKKNSEKSLKKQNQNLQEDQYLIKHSLELAKKASMKSLKAKEKSEISIKNKKNKETKRQTLKRGENLPTVIESILESGSGASFDVIESNYNSIRRQKSQASEVSEKVQLHQHREDNVSTKSNKKLKKKLEVNAKVKKGGKVFLKKVAPSKSTKALLDPNAELDL